jgi:hypothetical protein
VGMLRRSEGRLGTKVQCRWDESLTWRAREDRLGSGWRAMLPGAAVPPVTIKIITRKTLLRRSPSSIATGAIDFARHDFERCGAIQPPSDRVLCLSKMEKATRQGSFSRYGAPSNVSWREMIGSLGVRVHPPSQLPCPGGQSGGCRSSPARFAVRVLLRADPRLS